MRASDNILASMIACIGLLGLFGPVGALVGAVVGYFLGIMLSKSIKRST